MRVWTLLLSLSILALIVATLGGCLFGGGADEEAEGGEMPEGEMPSGPDAAGPPGPGGDMPGPPAGDMGPPPGDMGPPPGDMGPPPGDTAPPPDMPGAAPGPAPAGGGGSPAKALQLKHEGNYDAAAAEYRNVIASDPNNADAHWGLAWILAEQGKTDEAKAEFEAFLGLSDDQAKMKDAEAALQRL